MYVALDIETTGLDPEKHQVLELALVIDDRSQRVIDCPFYRTLVRHETIVGSPFALAMNAELLKQIGRGDGISPLAMSRGVATWLRSHKADRRVLTPLGKNVGSFDWQFLKRVEEFPVDLFGHRMLDVGSLYATPDGISSQEELCNRIAIEYDIPGKAHEALYDARVSLALARAKWGIDA